MKFDTNKFINFFFNTKSGLFDITFLFKFQISFLEFLLLKNDCVKHDLKLLKITVRTLKRTWQKCKKP